MLTTRALLSFVGGAAVLATLTATPATASVEAARQERNGGLSVQWTQCGSTPNSGDCAIGRARDSRREIWIDAKRALEAPATTRQALSVYSAATGVYRYGASGLNILRVCVADQPGVAAECSPWQSFPMG